MLAVMVVGLLLLARRKILLSPYLSPLPQPSCQPGCEVHLRGLEFCVWVVVVVPWVCVGYRAHIRSWFGRCVRRTISPLRNTFLLVVMLVVLVVHIPAGMVGLLV